jgi:hypothetical protein
MSDHKENERPALAKGTPDARETDETASDTILPDKDD